jgi:hypothetical protein
MTKAILLLSIIGLTSCKKDYTCDCTITTNQKISVSGVLISQSASATTSSTVIKDKKNAAKTECEVNNNTPVIQNSNLGGTQSVEQTVTTLCNIK